MNKLILLAGLCLTACAPLSDDQRAILGQMIQNNQQVAAQQQANLWAEQQALAQSAQRAQSQQVHCTTSFIGGIGYTNCQ